VKPGKKRRMRLKKAPTKKARIGERITPREEEIQPQGVAN
jgi:hypothetical protein